MAEYLSPGVYVEEFESDGRPMEGVGTSTAGLIGLAAKGPIEGVPVLVTSVADFRRKFGGYLSENEFGQYRFLAYAVEQLFINGGTRCYVMRVAPSNAVQASNFKEGDKALLKITAKNVGAWGNNIKIIVSPSSKARTQVLSVQDVKGEKKRYTVKSSAGFNEGDVVVFSEGEKKFYNKVVKSLDNVLEFEKDFEVDIVDAALVPTKFITTCEFNMEIYCDDAVEVYEDLSFNVSASNFVTKKTAKSDIVIVEVGALETGKTMSGPYEMIAGKDDAGVFSISLSKGSNGTIDKLSAADFIGVDNGPGKRTGLQSFIDNDVVSLMAIPGVTDPNVQLTLVAHCENLASRFAVLDIPRDAKKVDDVIAHRNVFDSHYAALYHPWLQVFDPLDKKNIMIPPSGSMLGVYARSDQERGVHKAPANEVIRGCTGLDCQYNKGEQDILNPKGVNLIRIFPGQGIRVWGARTCTSNSIWKYVNVRRLFIFIEESIKANTNWVVFEPNNEFLWLRVNRTITGFLETVWRSGALVGASAQEAFFVDVSRNTMTQDDIDNGKLICVIGVAPVKPAEFVIFRITQKAKEASAG